MYLTRHILTRPSSFLRHFSHSATAAIPLHDELPDLQPLTYLPGFPRPNPKHDETILAIPRAISGKNIAEKERKAGRVPSIVFEQEDGEHGGNKRLISVGTKQIKKLVSHLGQSFFLSRLFELEVRSDFESEEIVEKVRVLPRKLHIKASTDIPLNVTFIRAPSNALLKVDIPLVFIGDDVSPGLKKGIGSLERILGGKNKEPYVYTSRGKTKGSISSSKRRKKKAVEEVDEEIKHEESEEEVEAFECDESDEGYIAEDDDGEDGI
ncbi:hypothetical protein TanjilG_00016 [Lupinus angustifolius]|uniref:Large ribosomal subunit protein bL25 L25 domain-containing protein n=1 Tax=Lupinus angustifolius TaxID=3871 RepID=A0A4P1QSR7_LUPAN|nr:hypothetical protein TanjilG_00016 [Lupinus angustifolius]